MKKLKNNRKTCHICEKEVKTYIVKKDVKFKIKGKEIIVNSERRLCENCNNEIYDFELDQKLSEKAIKLFNESNDGITSEQIKKIREKFNISQETFGKILGVAKKTINSYENNLSIPQDNVFTMLKSIINDERMLEKYANINIDKLTNFEKKKIFDKCYDNFIYQYEDLLNIDLIKEENEFNGYFKLDNNKLKNLLLYIMSKVIGKTKIYKALFFIDAISYNNSAQSITGLEYIKLDHGPVPHNLDFYINKLINDNVLEETIDIISQYEIYKYKVKIDIDTSLFDKTFVDNIINYINSKTARELSDYTHSLEAYKQTEYKDLISFDILDNIEI